MGANVINLSFGGSGEGGGYQSIINTVYNNYGAIVVASVEMEMTMAIPLLIFILLQVVIMSSLYQL